MVIHTNNLHECNSFQSLFSTLLHTRSTHISFPCFSYPFLITYLIFTSGTRQGTSYLKLILFPSYDYILIQPNNVFTSCFEFMILGWLYFDMNFIIYNHDNFEMVSPPLGRENPLPEAQQNYLILILTQINVNCKFKKLFICKVLQTNYCMCSLKIRKFEIPLSSLAPVWIEVPEGQLIDIVVSGSNTCLERERSINVKDKILQKRKT